jgi:hypothetical protein
LHNAGADSGQDAGAGDGTVLDAILE